MPIGSSNTTTTSTSNTDVLQSLAALDTQMLQQLDCAARLSEMSSLNTINRVTDLHKLSGRLNDYLQTAQQQDAEMQSMRERHGLIATEFSNFLQALPQQIVQQREVARLLTLTSKFDDFCLAMHQFHTKLLTALTEHHTELNQGLLCLLDAGQHHDVFKQIIGRQAPVFEQRHALLVHLLTEVHRGQPDLADLGARARALLDEYRALEDAHRPPIPHTDDRADRQVSQHIELF